MWGKARILLAAASIVAVVLITVIATTGSAATTARFTVVERARTDTVVDIGASGDSTGDLLTFHNKLYRGGNVVGRDQGVCTRIAVKKGTWECTWTNILAGGSITVEGPFYDTKDSTLAVTGGTGAYRRARGEMQLHALNDKGTKYAFSFSLNLG
jgi:allene oxide cyclase